MRISDWSSDVCASDLRAEAARLRLPGEGGVVRISRVRNLAGAPAIVEAIAAPLAIFPDLGRAGDLPNTLYALYESRYGVTVARAEERLRAVAADAEAAQIGKASCRERVVKYV